ncbi:alpha-L-rhamnosidase [Trichococcus patagoniensis]|uniref:alpha-L-rhamnosidase n=1 Tax=Trichococcus patagoniensis TaxID=382641 RepID=A0A2T5I7T9_9LACT|nr:family 78 glycoside hydrolase catalytic domain [Trichococcus patagoniensis]PTQ79868.1 alpha-L-rhamnosidase [Trichococcus patagoniensis]
MTATDPLTINGRIQPLRVSLGQASWITRLDNPLEKETEFLNERPNIILEKEFDVSDEIEEALIAICGLGYYTLYVNGHRMGESYLNNDVTNYDKTVYYDTYDIRNFLKKGSNKLSVELANGWYNAAPITILGKYNVRKQLAVGKPCLISQLTITTAAGEKYVIESDSSWKSKPGNYLFNNLYIGEVVTDADPVADTKQKTVKIAGPSGDLTPSFIPKIKRQKQYLPAVVTHNFAHGGILIDFGTIISGHFLCDISADFLGQITFLYAEELNADGTLSFDSSISGTYGVTDEEHGINAGDPIIQKDVIKKTEQEIYRFENQYCYHSFRYVLVKSNLQTDVLEELLSNVQAYSVHTDLASVSRFHSSSDELNRLWDAARNTRLNNIHSYFEDCTRERFGYGGDIVALIDSHLYSNDMHTLLKKVFMDFVNDQTPAGGIPQTAPYVGIMTNGTSNGAGSLGWQLVFPVLAARIEQYYQDTAFVQKHLSALVKHLDYLLAFDFDYIRYCCLGDWGSVDAGIQNMRIVSPDQEFCSASMYLILLEEYKELFAAHEVSETLMETLELRIAEARNATIALFRNADGSFASGTQSSTIFALKGRLFRDVEEQRSLEAKLVQRINDDAGIFRFGIFGMSWAYTVLSDIGEDDLIYNWLSRRQEPNYLSMLANGNQTLSEYFPVKNGANTVQGSLNHAMFSSYSAWMMEKLVGISVKKDRSIQLAPYFAKDLTEIKGSLLTMQGEIEAQWEQLDDNALMYSVTLPESLDYDFRLGETFQIINKEITTAGGDRLTIRLTLQAFDAVEAIGRGNV